MTGTDSSKRAASTSPPQDAVERLLAQAPARERPPSADEQKIRAALHREWRAQVARKRRHRWGLGLAAAASLALALLIVLRPGPDAVQPVAAVRLAVIEKIQGSAVAGQPGEGLSMLSSADALLSGQRLVTQPGSGLAIRWRDGTSVRIDQGSTLDLTAGGAVRIHTGRVYVDTGMARDDGSPLALLTPAGKLRHVGTRYMTAVSGAATRISVREGRVALGEAGSIEEVEEGTRLEVEADGRRSLDRAPAFGAEWRWAELLMAQYDLDGRTLAEFLDWVGRETGRVIEFASAEARDVALETILHGEVDLEPLEALQLVTRTSDLAAEVYDGIIRVRIREAIQGS